MKFSEFYLNENIEVYSKIKELYESNQDHYDFLAKKIEKDVELTSNQILDKYNELELETLKVLQFMTDDNYDEDDDISLDVDMDFPESAITEKLVKSVVVRAGKKKKRFKSDRPGHRIVLDPETGAPKEIKMSGSEKRNRKRAQRLGAKKRKAKSAISKLKRAISNKKRKILGVGKRK